MKKIRLYISKIRNHYFARIPDVIATKNQLSGGESIEVTIHNKTQDNQVELWETHPEDINEITFPAIISPRDRFRAYVAS